MEHVSEEIPVGTGRQRLQPGRGHHHLPICNTKFRRFMPEPSIKPRERRLLPGLEGNLPGNQPGINLSDGLPEAGSLPHGEHGFHVVQSFFRPGHRSMNGQRVLIFAEKLLLRLLKQGRRIGFPAVGEATARGKKRNLPHDSAKRTHQMPDLLAGPGAPKRQLTGKL